LAPEKTISDVVIEEKMVTEISLAGPVSQSRAEISGMAWCGEKLILLPQFPDRFQRDEFANVFSVPKEAIVSFLSGENTSGIEPDLIPFDQSGLNTSIAGFEGFEGIAFIGNRFYAVIETRQTGGMMGYIVTGTAAEDCMSLSVDPSSLKAIPPQADLGNMTDETLIIYNNSVYSMYEANGLNVNPRPVAHVFDPSLEKESAIDMATVEFRITDATEPNGQGLFWAINYFFPGDTKLKPATDQIAVEFGMGSTHQDVDQVERLVAFEIKQEAIVLADKPPIYLELYGSTARNWEGVVRFGDGFLLVTDEFPTTILAYVDGLKNE